MNEIEKLYKNAEIKKDCFVMHECSATHLKCKNCNKISYPPFTAEKQLELIKRFIPAYPLNFTYGFLQAYPFDEGLAHCINSIWEKFTPKDKQQIKEILE